MAAQAAETARVGEQAAGITAQIGAEEARADQAFKSAESQWKRQLTSDVIGAGASLASAGITQAGQLNEAKLMAERSGYFGSGEDVQKMIDQGWTPQMLQQESARVEKQVNTLIGSGVELSDIHAELGLGAGYTGAVSSIEEEIVSTTEEPSVEQLATAEKERYDKIKQDESLLAELREKNIGKGERTPVVADRARDKKIEEEQIAETKKYLAEQAELDVIGQTAYKKTKAKLTKEAAEAAKLKKAQATVTAGAERTAARKAKLAEEAELDAIEQKVYKETKERLTEEARLDTIEQRVYKETKERLTKEAKAKATVTAGAKRVRDKNKRIAEQYAAKVRGEATASMKKAREQQVQVGEPDEKTLDAVVNTVTKFESGDRSERHNNPGAMVWSAKLQEEYPEIEKGDSFTKDGKTYYTAKFKDKATGERINKEIISKIWTEVGGDTLKFYSRWSGLPKDSATVKNYAEEIKRLTGA